MWLLAGRDGSAIQGSRPELVAASLLVPAGEATRPIKKVRSMLASTTIWKEKCLSIWWRENHNERSQSNQGAH